MNPELVEAFRVPPRRTTLVDLHGPWSSRGPDPEAPTEVWQHGQLVAVSSEARRAELAARWGAARCQEAVCGPVGTKPEDQGTAAALPAGTRILSRAFRHAGCKAAQLGPLEPGALHDHGALGAALEGIGAGSRDAALARLLADSDEPVEHWVARVDALDRDLDDQAGGESWAMAQVPAHCRALGPLRNLLRAADRRGVLFRRMRFADFEREDRFVPELPLVCLDEEIHGGGFDHDLFHACVPTLAGPGQQAFEVGMLAVEAAGQAFNSAVLASRHTGPAYDGWATWPGASLFDELAAATGHQTLPEQIRAYAILGLVGHPEFPAAEARAAFAALAAPAGAADEELLEALVEKNARYLERDAAWLRGLWPRYATPIFEVWRPALTDRLVATPAALLGRLDALLDELEDIDLRRLDHPLSGATARLREDVRRAALKGLELDLLFARGSERSRRVVLAPSIGQALALLDELGESLVMADAITRLPLSEEREVRADHHARELERLETRSDAITQTIGATARAAAASQRLGVLGGPAVPEAFLDSPGELFDGVFYEPPVHVGADWPWLR